MCVFNHFHDEHKIIEIKNIESLKKDNINLKEELELLQHVKDFALSLIKNLKLFLGEEI